MLVCIRIMKPLSAGILNLVSILTMLGGLSILVDAPMDGTSDHEEAKASNQTPKPLNQELKDVILMFGSPRTVVEHHGQTMVSLPTDN